MNIICQSIFCRLVCCEVHGRQRVERPPNGWRFREYGNETGDDVSFKVGDRFKAPWSSEMYEADVVFMAGKICCK